MSSDSLKLMEQWEVGKRLEAARIHAGLSKRGAAAEAGISESWWRQLEAGTVKKQGEPEPITAPADTISKAAIAVGLDPTELLLLAGHDAHSSLDTRREVLAAQCRGLTPDQVPIVEAFFTGLFTPR